LAPTGPRRESARGRDQARLRHALKTARAVDVKIIDMAHGRKKTRILAWTFLKPALEPAPEARRRGRV
jgi:23S rRNA A1618 N6-methylase RlmF